MKTFEYNNYIVLFISFLISKVIWKIFTIFYVHKFRRNLEFGLINHPRDGSLPVFRMILTSPENWNVDVSDAEAEPEDAESISLQADQEITLKNQQHGKVTEVKKE